MTDQKTPSAGDPVEEPAPVDDVVGRANEGLADAEAVRTAPREEDVVVEEVIVTDAADATQDAPAQDVVVDEVVVEETVIVDEVPAAERDSAIDAPPVAPETVAAPVTPVPLTPPVADDVPWYDRPESVPMDDAPVVAAAPQPIFVQAPEAPHPRGNRGAAGAIGLLATLAFALLMFGVLVGYGFLVGAFDAAAAVDYMLAIVGSALFWVPVIVFFFAFWTLGAILNRARWAHWVIWGLLVGVASYAGYLLGALIQAPFWELTAREGATLLEGQLFFPYAILSFVLGRELTIWFGAWVARRGKRVTELNEEAQREYERTLEAGPRLHQG